MRRCVIVGGAPILDYEGIRMLLREDDYMIYCDGGLKHEEKLAKKAELIIGDFDSFPRPDRPEELIQLPHEKDDTDSIYGVKEGLKRGYQEFLLIGVVGGRLDHTLVNVYGLLMIRNMGAHAVMVDDYSSMELVGREPVEIPDSFPYFSLVNITGCAKGIHIEQALYNLDGGEITCEYQYGTSNEVLPGQKAKVWVENGELLLIRNRRDGNCMSDNGAFTWEKA